MFPINNSLLNCVPLKHFFSFDLCKCSSNSTENKEKNCQREKLWRNFLDREEQKKLFNNKRINIFFIAWGMSLCSIDFLFNNNTLFFNNEKNKKNIYMITITI